MPEYEGFKIVYEVIHLPKGKWGILIEIIRRVDGEILMARHNPFRAILSIRSLRRSSTSNRSRCLGAR